MARFLPDVQQLKELIRSTVCADASRLVYLVTMMCNDA